MAITCGRTAGAIKANGKTIKCMDSESFLGLTAKSTKASISRIKNKAMASFIGLMAVYMMDNGWMENSMEKQSTPILRESK